MGKLSNFRKKKLENDYTLGKGNNFLSLRGSAIILFEVTWNELTQKCVYIINNT